MTVNGFYAHACQFFVDFVESENSNGFHAPQESARLLGVAIDTFRQGRCPCAH